MRTAHEQKCDLINARCDLASEERDACQVSFLECSKQDAARVNHRLPPLHELRNAVEVTFREEVRDRVVDAFGDEPASDLAVMDGNLLGPIDLAEPLQAVARKPLAEDAVVIGEDFADDMARVVRERRARVPVVRKLDECDGKRPASTSSPRRIIDAESGAED